MYIIKLGDMNSFLDKVTSLEANDMFYRIIKFKYFIYCKNSRCGISALRFDPYKV